MTAPALSTTSWDLSRAVVGDLLEYRPGRGASPQLYRVVRITGGPETQLRHLRLRTVCPACDGSYTVERWTDDYGVWTLDRDGGRVRKCKACRATGRRRDSKACEEDQAPLPGGPGGPKPTAEKVLPIRLAGLVVGDLVHYRGQPFLVVQLVHHDHGARYALRSWCAVCGRDYVMVNVPARRRHFGLRCPACVHDNGAKWRYRRRA